MLNNRTIRDVFKLLFYRTHLPSFEELAEEIIEDQQVLDTNGYYTALHGEGED